MTTMNPAKSPPNIPLRSAPMHQQRPLGPTSPVVSWNDPAQRMPLIMLVGLVAMLVIAYWDMFALTSAAWTEGLYSHGWIVPLFALGLLWMRWEPLGAVPMSERLIGLGVLAAGLVTRYLAAWLGSPPIDHLSFLPSIFGVFMLVGGLNIIRWAGPALGFLVFMFPLPPRVELTVLLKLQTLAAICSTFVLQTLGVPAFRSGNVINISGMDLFIADACSGLRMLTIFVALAVAMVFLIERPWWDKFIILLSSVPIALVVNIVRITVTGLMYMWWPKSTFVQHLSHDWAGWFMMPLALGLLWLELQILERLTIPVETGQLKPVGARAPGMAVPMR
jgi:exosortase